MKLTYSLGDGSGSGTGAGSGGMIAWSAGMQIEGKRIGKSEIILI